MIAPTQFRKKPVVISAIQWTGENLVDVIHFTDGRPPNNKSSHAGMMWDQYVDVVRKDGLKIFTMEGKMDASIGDWIIKGVKGEYYPCKPEIFALTYDDASASTDLSQAAVAAARNAALVEAANEVEGIEGYDNIGGEHPLVSMILALRDKPAPAVTVRAYLLRHRDTGKEEIIDAKKYNPTKLDFWVSPAAMASVEIIPLSAIAGGGDE